MGHADRPWLNNSLSLDAQSGSVCLSLAGRCYPDSHSNAYRDTHCNRHCDGIFYTDTETYTHTEDCTDAKAASYAATAAVARNWQQLPIS